MNPIVLHNPGCNDPEKICSPHPVGPGEQVQMMINDPVGTLGVVAFIGVVCMSMGLVQRYRAGGNDE